MLQQYFKNVPSSPKQVYVRPPTPSNTHLFVNNGKSGSHFDRIVNWFSFVKYSNLQWQYDNKQGPSQNMFVKIVKSNTFQHIPLGVGRLIVLFFGR